MNTHIRRLLRSAAVLLAAAAVLSLSSCSEISQLEKQAIISAVGIDKGDDERFMVSVQVFQSMGAGSATPVDSSQANTVIVSAQANTIAECMDKISLILGRKINTGHNQYIVIGSEALELPLSDTLDYFIRSEQTYLGVPVISSEGKAREIIDVELQNEVETAIAVANVIKHAVEKGESLDVDLLRLANSKDAALPVIRVVKPESEGSDGGEEGESAAQKEEPQLWFSGTRIVRDGELIYTASAEETQGYCWLTGDLRSAQLCIYPDGEPLNVTVTMTSHKDTVRRRGDGSYEMVYKIRARIKLLDSFGGDTDKICALVTEELERRCEQSFEKLSQHGGIDFLGVSKAAKSRYPRAALEADDLLSHCGISAEFYCTLDK